MANLLVYKRLRTRKIYWKRSKKWGTQYLKGKYSGQNLLPPINYWHNCLQLTFEQLYKAMKTQETKIKTAYKEGGKTSKPMTESISKEEGKKNDPEQYQEKIEGGVHSAQPKK